MAEEVWMLQTKKADFKQIGARFRIDPVTARIIRNRGIPRNFLLHKNTGTSACCVKDQLLFINT